MVKQILLLCGEYNLKSACVCGVEDVIDTVLDKRHLTDKYDFSKRNKTREHSMHWAMWTEDVNKTYQRRLLDVSIKS